MHGFLSLARECGDGKMVLDTAVKTGIDPARIASKRVVQKTAESTGYLIENKITSLGKTKSKEKEDERQELYIPLKERQQIIGDLKSFHTI